MDMMLSPPRSKKLSSIPTWGTPRTWAKVAQSSSSWGVRGARLWVVVVNSGSGRALRSSLPFAVRG
ncbi:hypothetical protein, partial [Streptomyces sp. NPDC091416]|uniref:hypothetical protein n=1 Tax=Streptomyces sp. NPDC091416 TaxID=3366003 RepID=UPI00381BCD8F